MTEGGREEEREPKVHVQYSSLPSPPFLEVGRQNTYGRDGQMSQNFCPKLGIYLPVYSVKIFSCHRPVKNNLMHGGLDMVVNVAKTT